MKLVITEKEQGKIIANQTVIKLEVNPFVSDAGKIPLSLFSSKGDLIVGKGGLNPVRLPIGSDGQTLVVNDSSLSGLSWKTIGWGTVSLINAEALPVTAGTVCTQADDPGTFRTATDADTENLYVASENILSGQIGVLFAASGASCYVLCTSAAVNAGENLEVSSTPGMAQKATSGTVFATAMTSKPAGVVSQVQCILTNSTLTVTPITGGGTGATTAAAARSNLEITPANIGAMLNRPPNIEFQPPAANSGFGGFIDFHYNQSAADYTARIIEDEQGKLKVDPNPAVTLAGLRNIYAGTAKLTPGSSTLATGVIYLVYE